MPDTFWPVMGPDVIKLLTVLLGLFLAALIIRWINQIVNWFNEFARRR
jgi:hypothetical protein